jgi:hypothetical protein
VAGNLGCRGPVGCLNVLVESPMVVVRMDMVIGPGVCHRVAGEVVGIATTSRRDTAAPVAVSGSFESILELPC